MRLSHLRTLTTLALTASLLAGLATLLVPGSHAGATQVDQDAGHVYVLNNDLVGSNSITVYNRATNGSLTVLGTTSIGGLGNLAAFANGTQGSLILAPEKHTLFAVDAGSDQISVVKVNNGQLTLHGVFPSFGAGPVSLTYRNGLLYVLNAANASSVSANVVGFHVDDEGGLLPIAGASKLLSTAHPNPAQVLIDPSGRYLLVTEKVTNLIDVYTIGRDGSLNGPTTYASTGVYPFGMAFNPASPQHELIVADAFGGPNMTGGATAYRLDDGKVEVINGPVFDYQVAPCWMVITKNGHYAYTSDAYNYTISGYRINKDGTISLLTSNGITANTPSDTFPLEEALSSNSHYLYVLDSRLLLTPPGVATLSGFQIGNDGSLTSVVNSAQITLPFTAIGLAAD